MKLCTEKEEEEERRSRCNSSQVCLHLPINPLPSELQAQCLVKMWVSAWDYFSSLTPSIWKKQIHCQKYYEEGLLPLLKALNAFKKPFTPTDQMTLVQFYSLCEGRGQAEVTVGDNPQQLVSGTAFISSQSSLFGGKGGIKPLLSYGENYSSVIPFFYILICWRGRSHSWHRRKLFIFPLEVQKGSGLSRF